MKYELIDVNSGVVEKLHDRWIGQLDDYEEAADLVASEVERHVDWFRKYADNPAEQGDLLFQALVEKDTQNVLAVVELTDAKRAKDPAIKFLNIFLEPRLVLDFITEIHREKLREILDVCTSAIGASMHLARQNGTNKLKIFGRTDEMRSLFDSLIANTGEVNGLDLYRQGKWLVIEAAN